MNNPHEMTTGVRPGDILAGKYRVERVLGQGGMGIVVAAHHIQLDEKVALKFLLPEALGSAEAVARFVREARAAVKIKSEHVARVSDVGTLETGAPYMVMEYLEGGDLSDWLKQRGPMPVEQASEFVLQACVAVADAHALGIVHRDLKPANLFCVRRSDGQLSIKVLDFGISKLTDLSGTGPSMAMTKTSALMGSPLYMSPEQMRSSKDVDAQTDIWALGIILFELLTGHPAFTAESVTELAIRVASEPAPLVRTSRPDVPPGVEAVIAKCLEKDKRQRFRNVAELAYALLPFAPKRAKASVDRISGIIQAAGLSTSALAVPASPPADSTQLAPGQASAGTLPPVGRTTMGGSKGKTAAVGATIVGGVVVVAGWRRCSCSGAPPIRTLRRHRRACRLRRRRLRLRTFEAIFRRPWSSHRFPPLPRLRSLQHPFRHVRLSSNPPPRERRSPPAHRPRPRRTRCRRPSLRRLRLRRPRRPRHPLRDATRPTTSTPAATACSSLSAFDFVRGERGRSPRAPHPSTRAAGVNQGRVDGSVTLGQTMAARARVLPPALVYFLASSFTLQSFLIHWEGGLRFELDSILAFAVPRPYAYRVLAPLLVRAVCAVIPERVAQAVVESYGHGIVEFAASRAGCAGPPTMRFVAATWLMLGALWGTALVWRALLRSIFRERALLADVVPAIAILALPATFTGGGFIYDFPELALVSAAFLAFQRRRWVLWYVLLFVAVLNKEASALMMVWWIAARSSLPRATWWRHTIASGALAASVVATLWLAFRHTLGYVAQPNFEHNVRYWASLRWLVATQDAFGTALPFPIAFNLVNLAALYAVWARGKAHVPAEVARAFALSALTVAPLLLLFGFENEIRVFAIAAPPLVVLAGGALSSLYPTTVVESP